MRAELDAPARPRAGGVARGALRCKRARLPALLVALGCGVLLYGFLWAGDFTVRTVIVRGVALGDAGEVAGAAGALNQSVFTVDADAVAARVATLPTVERASVHAELPDKLVIDVVERTPALAWQAGGRTLLVDERGHVLTEADAGALPRVAVAGDPPAVGASVPVARVAAALAIGGALGDGARDLRWSDADGFQATLVDGRVIRFGDETRVPLKLAALTAALADGTNWTVLDVSEPDRPYFK